MRPLPICLAPLLFVSITFAASPPDYVNYQGVLRDASNAPVDGAHDMVFRFHSAETGGDEILVDRQTGADSTAVTVTGGMFSAHLGAGALLDGSGPGTYASLGEVFRAYGDVWLSIEVAGELLEPRVRVISAPYAHNATTLDGRAAGEFLDTSATTQTKAGRFEASELFADGAGWGVEAHGVAGGGYFADASATAYAELGSSGYGVRGFGSNYGAYFKDTNTSAQAFAGYHNWGIWAIADVAGGYFQHANGSGYANVGVEDRGIEGYGNAMGGYFEDLDHSGFARVGAGNHGIQAYGSTSAGYFEESDGSGYAHVAYSDRGIEAWGNEMGGYFADRTHSGYAAVGYGDRGIQALGNLTGGYFEDRTDSGEAYVGYGDRGIWGRGTFAGGTFSHPNTQTHWADVSTPTRKIVGTGTVSFVQNHPYEQDKVIVYAAPEGDEVAVYTRGSARLSDGLARVALGETFALVANPDIGLTVHLTARGRSCVLHVVEIATDRLIAGADDPGCADARFDYLVHGLRIGFEELAPVQIKERNAFVPSRAAIDAAYQAQPELRRFNALERFKAMAVDRGEGGPLDLSRSQALVAAVNENRAAIIAAASAAAEAERGHSGDRPSVSPAVGDTVPSNEAAALPLPGGQPDSQQGAFVAADPDRAAAWFPVAEPVELGDVLALDPADPSLLRRAASLADPAVVGIAAAASRETAFGALEAPMAQARYVSVKVDAGYGAIHPGDLLVASPTPGHAMRALEVVPGTLLGKALEPLETGTGLVRLVWMLR